MKNIMLKAVTIVVCMMFCSEIKAQPTSKIRISEKMSLNINEKFTLKSEFAQRFDNRNTDAGAVSGGKIDEWEEIYNELSIDYKINNNWVTNFSYRNIQAKINTPKYDIENRIFGAVEYKFMLGKMSWGLRTRLIMRVFDTGIKYRLTETFRFDIPTGMRINKRDIKYLFYDELHIDLKGGYSNNEIRIGFNVPFASVFDVDIYYGNEYGKRINGVYNITNLIGCELGYKF